MKTIRAEKGLVFRHKETKEYAGVLLSLRPYENEGDYEQVPLPTDNEGKKQLFKAIAGRRVSPHTRK